MDRSLGTTTEGDHYTNLKDNVSQSLQKRCFLVAKYHKEKFKAKLNCLVKLDALQKLRRSSIHSKFIFPAFIVLMKNQDKIRFVSNFKELRKWITRSLFLVLFVRDTLNKLEVFQFATIIEISIGC